MTRTEIVRSVGIRRITSIGKLGSHLIHFPDATRCDDFLGKRPGYTKTNIRRNAGILRSSLEQGKYYLVAEINGEEAVNPDWKDSVTIKNMQKFLPVNRHKSRQDLAKYKKRRIAALRRLDSIKNPTDADYENFRRAIFKDGE